MRELDIVIDPDWFSVWEYPFYPKTRSDIRSLTSLYSPHLLDESEKYSNGAFTTAITFGTFMNPKKKNCIVLFSVFPPQNLNPNQVILHAKNLCCNYLNNSISDLVEGVSPSYLILPSDTERNSIVSEIRKNKADVSIRRFKYLDHGKTLDNMLKRAITRLSEKRVYVMRDPINKGELRNQDRSFVNTIYGYPEENSRGMVWCLTQAILFLEGMGFFLDVPENKNVTRQLRPFYGLDNI